MSRIRFAGLADTERLMHFMHRHWRADHILSRNRALFLHDFQDGERLNIAIAEDDDGDIIGLFGFMKYSHRELPDIAGSLWKVIDGTGEAMLGLRLRRFVIEQVPHRYFAAPGAGLQTRAIYRLIGMDWIEMDQYYRVNPQHRSPELCRNPSTALAMQVPARAEGYHSDEIEHPDRLSDFPFDDFDQLAPLKDLAYIERRFFRHPISSYRVFRVRQWDRTVAIAVCRVAAHAGANALRIVDYYGDERHMPALIAHLDGVVRDEGHEYLDFVCSGFSPEALSAAGLSRLDLDSDETVVPNYFEPFVRANVRVYAVADHDPAIRPRLCKADGDQDRPNFDGSEGKPGEETPRQAVGQ